MQQLFEEIKHGDADHQKWLRQKMETFCEEPTLPFKAITEFAADIGWSVAVEAQVDEEANVTGIICGSKKFIDDVTDGSLIGLEVYRNNRLETK